MPGSAAPLPKAGRVAKGRGQRRRPGVVVGLAVYTASLGGRRLADDQHAGSWLWRDWSADGAQTLPGRPARDAA